ncbi:MAG TPA: hypothetical protein VN889_08715 [Solirubrobacteraceae bacterium]|nr:hypothetical protein [Solirubrobacteraceae bacterium]
MRKLIPAVVLIAAALFAASMLGVAVAEAPTSTPLRTVSVEGIANAPVAQTASAAEATAVYREAMASAITDGQSKATFLAEKTGTTLGSVQSVTEGGGYIWCRGGTEQESAEYEGEQPDFGAGQERGYVAAPEAAATATPSVPKQKAPVVKKRKKAKRPVAKKAAAGSCALTAQVSLIYTIN